MAAFVFAVTIVPETYVFVLLIRILTVGASIPPYCQFLTVKVACVPVASNGNESTSKVLLIRPVTVLSVPAVLNVRLLPSKSPAYCSRSGALAVSISRSGCWGSPEFWPAQLLVSHQIPRAPVVLLLLPPMIGARVLPPP